MNIIVVGCGRIGTAILNSLIAEGHDLTAVDKNSEVLTSVTDALDVMGVCGNGVDCDVLAEADVSKCDMFIAVTDSDELNMLSCFLAKRMGAVHTIARIRNPEYNDQSLEFVRSQLDISMAINPEFQAAKEIFDILKLPSAAKIETFSGQNLEMIELRLKADSALDGTTVREMRTRYSAKFLICAVQRGDSVYIPDGAFELKSGDKIGVSAAPSEMQKLLRELGLQKKKAKSVMIMGGGNTAYYLAKMLTDVGISVKIIEPDRELCNKLCASLPKAVIINGDEAQGDLLTEEGINSVDAFVALTATDEENMLVSFFASAQKVPKVITRVNRDDLSAMAEQLGMECVVSPRKIISDVLVRYARALHNSRGSNVETLYKLMDGMAEALEFNVNSNADARLTDKPLKELSFKPGILIAGIIRGRKPVIPNGDDMILAGDRVIVLATDQRLQDLSDILK